MSTETSPDTAHGLPAPAAWAPEPAGVGRPPLRVGLLVDGFVQPAWIERVLQEVTEGGIARIALVILNGATAGDEAPRPSRGTLARLRTWHRNRALLAYELYSKLDARRYRVASDPFRTIDLRPLVGDAPVLTVAPRQTKFCDYFEDDAVQAIRAHDLDVVLRFGFRILKGRALDIARYGVWSFHHGDNTVNRGGPAGFWEVMDGHEATGAVLQRLTEELDGGAILARATASTNPFSVTVNRANYYWQAAALLTRELRRLWEDGPAPDARAAEAEWSAYSAPLYTAPHAGRMLRGALSLARRLVGSKLSSLLRKDQWFLAYSARKNDASGDVPQGVMYRLKELVPPKDRYWADPFPVVDGERRWLFFEEHPFAARDAHIAVLEIDAKGVAGPPRTVLARPHHLSYPFVFRWEGAWYMMPETLSQRAVELYRATRFPDEWEYVGPMLRDVAAVDPTIACIDGRWWLFVGVVIAGATEATALHLYHADSPLGPWTAHRRNPVRIDVRGARPAGRLFQHGGRWYRPGQDGAPRYGSATIVHRIDAIDESRYEETVVSRIAPTWRPGLRGVHTLNAAGGVTAIDVLHSIPRW